MKNKRMAAFEFYPENINRFYNATLQMTLYVHDKKPTVADILKLIYKQAYGDGFASGKAFKLDEIKKALEITEK